MSGAAQLSLQVASQRTVPRSRSPYGSAIGVEKDPTERPHSMSGVLQDVRYALRQLRRSPGFTAVAVLTLALGIGANTAIFSIFNATLLRPLPYKDPGRIVILWSTIPRWGFSGPGSLTDPDYVQWQQQNQVFDQIAAFRGQTSNLTGRGIPERLTGSTATASLFPLLGVPPELGRVFSAEEQLPGHENVVLLSHGLWARRFGSDPDIVGKSITLDGKSFTVRGVMPARLQFPNEADFWTPMHQRPVQRNGSNHRAPQARGNDRARRAGHHAHRAPLKSTLVNSAELGLPER